MDFSWLLEPIHANFGRGLSFVVVRVFLGVRKVLLPPFEVSLQG